MHNQRPPRDWADLRREFSQNEMTGQNGFTWRLHVRLYKDAIWRFHGCENEKSLWPITHALSLMVTNVAEKPATPYSTLKTETADCYEITWGHNPERHSFKNVPVSTGWSIFENIYIMVVADEKTASQRPVTRPSILVSTHSNTSPRSWIHSYSPDPSTWSVPTSLLNTSLSTQKFTLRQDNFTYTKQQPTEEPEAEPKKMKMWRRNDEEQNETWDNSRRLKRGQGRIIRRRERGKRWKQNRNKTKRMTKKKKQV